MEEIYFDECPFVIDGIKFDDLLRKINPSVTGFSIVFNEKGIEFTIQENNEDSQKFTLQYGGEPIDKLKLALDVYRNLQKKEKANATDR